jgi:hypothetical protein
MIAEIGHEEYVSRQNKAQYLEAGYFIHGLSESYRRPSPKQFTTDASDMIWEIRMQKSETEIAVIQNQ